MKPKQAKGFNEVRQDKSRQDRVRRREKEWKRQDRKGHNRPYKMRKDRDLSQVRLCQFPAVGSIVIYATASNVLDGRYMN